MLWDFEAYNAAATFAKYSYGKIIYYVVLELYTTC